MRRIFVFAIVPCAVLTIFFSACGDDKMERGIPDTEDSASPIDQEQLDMTEEERRKKDDV